MLFAGKVHIYYPQDGKNSDEVKDVMKKVKSFVLILLVIFCISGCAMFENSYSDKLYTAIVNDDYDEFKRLLQQGGDVNQMRSNLKWLSAIDYENL